MLDPMLVYNTINGGVDCPEVHEKSSLVESTESILQGPLPYRLPPTQPRPSTDAYWQRQLQRSGPLWRQQNQSEDGD